MSKQDFHLAKLTDSPDNHPLPKPILHYARAIEQKTIDRDPPFLYDPQGTPMPVPSALHSKTLTIGLHNNTSYAAGANPLNERIEWLLEGEPWVEYRTRVDLLCQSESNLKVVHARKEVINHPKVQSLLEELKDWPGTVISSHKSAGQPFHKLSFVADLGLRKGDPYIDEIVGKMFEHKSAEGPFQLPTNVPKHFGGSGSDEWAWALCDAPIVVYSLARFGLDKDEQVKTAVKYMVGLIRDNGWPRAR
jgi:hypothetical protein